MATFETSQQARAWAMAYTYGHLWATVCAETGVGPGETDDLEAYVRQHAPEGSGPGIVGPTPSDECDRMGQPCALVHTTATGRLRWQIARDARVTIEVYRRGLAAPVAVASVEATAPDWRGDLPGDPVVAVYPGAEWRHIVALHAAVSAALLQPETLWEEKACHNSVGG